MSLTGGVYVLDLRWWASPAYNTNGTVSSYSNKDRSTVIINCFIKQKAKIDQFTKLVNDLTPNKLINQLLYPYICQETVNVNVLMYQLCSGCSRLIYIISTYFKRTHRYTQGNQIMRHFGACNYNVKCVLLKSHCTNMHAPHLVCSYRKGTLSFSSYHNMLKHFTGLAKHKSTSIK